MAKTKFKYFHKIQALTLVIAIILLWFSFGLSHNTAMIISTILIALNVIPEFMS